MENLKIETNIKSIKVMYVLLTILLVLPSAIYIIGGNTILDYNSDFYLLRNVLKINSIFDGILFLGILIILNIMYVIILKNYKIAFKNISEIVKFIIVVSMLFMLILPMTSTDVFYYIATGWSEAKYGINPYYTSVEEVSQTNDISNDDILNKMPYVWRNQKIVYGPIWPLICKILSFFSFGILPLALLIFKFFNLCVHILNCYLINKLSNRKLFTLIYALNPLILFEGLTNVHNDILLVFFILLALYLAIKRKKIILSVLCFAIATAIKYVAILLIPFVVIYFYRKEKFSKRLLKAFGLSIIFIITLDICYLFYTKDWQVLVGILIQQSKFTKSLALCLYLFISPEIATNCLMIFMMGFVGIYLVIMIKQLIKKEIKLNLILRTNYKLLLLFLFMVITNFQTWYIWWLVPLIVWQNKKTINSFINLTISAELSSIIFFWFNESYVYGKFYWISMMVLWFLFNKININKFIKITNEDKK